ncbi:MAG: lipase family protein [Gammaproteobacteria bacterium]|nr:lipase family protein [Gammaproteobacteria bacterium]
MTDTSEVYRYAEFAKAAYLSRAELEHKFPGSVLVHELARSKVQLILIKKPDTNIQWIAVRGTANPKNVMVDFWVKVLKEPALGVYLHGGFLHAAREAFDAIRPRLDPEAEVRITGHSLGGAVAQILAALLAEDSGRKMGRTITFGQPMVTDSNGVKVLQKYPLLRVVNRWDPVTVLPYILARTHFEFPPTFFFHHAGPQLMLYKNLKTKCSPPAKLVRFVFGYKRLIFNHFIDLYLQRLHALLQLEHRNTENA